MSDYEFSYAVTLVSTNKRALISSAHKSPLELLTDFIQANNGKHVGFFEQDGEVCDDIAIVKMTEATSELLHAENVRLLRVEGDTPYISRIIGECFDICKAAGIVRHPCNAEKRYELGMPI